MCEQLTQPTKKDAEAIAHLLEQLVGEAPDVPSQQQQMAKLICREDVHLLVYREQGAIVGFVMGIVCPHICPTLSPFFVIEGLIVDQQHRRRGIARQLMTAAEMMAQSAGCRYLTLASQACRRDAHKLYESLGYNHDAAFQKFL